MFSPQICIRLHVCLHQSAKQRSGYVSYEGRKTANDLNTAAAEITGQQTHVINGALLIEVFISNAPTHPQSVKKDAFFS